MSAAMKIFFLTAMLMVGLSSCGSNDGGRSEPARPQFQGDLVEKANSLYSAKNEAWFYTCDFSQKDKVFLLAAAVEANRENIVKIKAELISKSPNVKVITLNGFDFIDLVIKTVQPDVWQKSTYSWAAVYAQYLEIKNDPMSPFWLEINAQVRSLILEDSFRIESLSHPSVRRQSENEILSAFAEIEKCYLDSSCISLNFSPNALSWLKEGPAHRRILSRMNLNDTVENKRADIGFLFADIGWAARRFRVVKNSSVKVDGNTLVVPLDVSILAADSENFIKTIEAAWSGLGLTVKVVNSWDGYTVKIDSTPGERAFVSYDRKLMQLYSPARLTTVNHEFGHVLGLPDTYYTSFNEINCEYIDESNDADIMSTSSTGSVLPSHVQKLKDTYGLK